MVVVVSAPEDAGLGGRSLWRRAGWMGVVGHIGESISRWMRGMLNLESWIGGPSREERSIVYIHMYVYTSISKRVNTGNSENKRPNDGHDYNNIITDQNEE